MPSLNTSHYTTSVHLVPYISTMSRHSRREEVEENGENMDSHDSQDNGELIYDPDQDREERRALRHDYRKLQDNG